MLPIYLSLEGLYSYQKKQEVDFTQLTEGGLFGIFGAVGSGKSSILEAISFALYGEIERLNKQEKRAYNMLNLKSDTAIIDFHFLNFEGRKFRFVAQWRRKKKFEETTSIERYAYEWKDSNWLPLESADGARVTNLSYPNFRRTIIIPQGQFMEFLELKGKERSDMMKEIFFLNQYDLGPKVSLLQSDNNKKIEHIKGALTGYEEVSEEIIVEQERSLIESKRNLTNVKLEFEKIAQQLHALRLEKENKSDLDHKEQQLAELELQHPQIQRYEKELQQFESVTQNFREPINNLHDITSRKEQLLIKIEKLKDNKQLLNTQIAETASQLESIKEDYEALATSRKKTDDYRLLITNTDLQQQKIELQSRVDRGTPYIEQTRQKEKELSVQLGKEEEQLDTAKNSRIQTQELMDVENWYQKQEQLQKDALDIHIKIAKLTQDLTTYRGQLEEINLSETNWQEILKDKIDKVAAASNLLKEKENALLVKQELSQYVLKLHDGSPCPLCGSLEHPAPMHEEDWVLEVKVLNNERDKLTQLDQELREQYAKVSAITVLITDKLNDTKGLKQQEKEISDLISMHDSTFTWNNFEKGNRSSFETQKKQAQQLEVRILEQENSIKDIRKQIQETQENLAKYEKSLDDFKNQVKIVDAKISHNIQQLKTTADHTSYEKTGKATLVKALAELERKIETVEKQYIEWNEILNQRRTQFAAVAGQYTEAHEQYITLTAQLQALQGTINSLLKEFQFEDITIVKSILEKSFDILKTREKIQQFYVQYNTLQTRIAELRELMKNSTFSQEVFEEIEKIHELKKEELELELTLSGTLEKELARLTIELGKKKTLLSTYEQLNSRKENLRTLDNMFKGNGFINYVSSIHLARLCEIANQRFHRLTKNQLSLCLNESNEFEVIDFLHEGHQRSVKTLSGGQSFQASLCLALALAENIQSLNKADRNFFFIDEGFGTQDAESINTVFDTLQYLHHENRVVGIISHVDELKERIPRSVSVTKDLEKGSQITHN
ncbi:AAA family ATPase [Sphingobacterium yanglingense]|uniref:Exonuclease SbcC n=1 Tax=Sphingobacterium yanglingense TaxID=1437280 RepID=A0A4R6WE35_9SPHI|nr:SbcC/MukB-like Walker B domain-containing protein [Sphingobacterium yanglingense]TDQ78049.1 exonuclease SbcC [Sphingobacterium yanglingense]